MRRYDILVYRSTGRRNPVEIVIATVRERFGSHINQTHISPPSPADPRCSAGPNPISFSSRSKSSGRNFRLFAFSLSFYSHVRVRIRNGCQRNLQGPCASPCRTCPIPGALIRTRLLAGALGERAGRTRGVPRLRNSSGSIWRSRI